MWSTMIILGVLALLGGGGGYFMADAKLNDGDFRWEHYGSSTYGEMVNLRNISQYAIVIGILLIIIGVILYAVNASKQNGGVKQSSFSSANINSASSGINCSFCGKTLAIGGKFCPHCGKEHKETARRCTCGTLLDDDAIFCTKCGRKYVTPEEDT